jgi:hypothetical protein
MSDSENKGSYDTLVSQINQISHNAFSDSASPINTALQVLAPCDLPAPPQAKAGNYPCVCFWTQKKWTEWNESAEGRLSQQNDKFHNTRYLENITGERLNVTHVTNILNSMWEIWHFFCHQNFINANATWMTMPLSLKKAFCSETAQLVKVSVIKWIKVVNHEPVLLGVSSVAIPDGSSPSRTRAAPSSPNDDAVPTGGSNNNVTLIKPIDNGISIRSSNVAAMSSSDDSCLVSTSDASTFPSTDCLSPIADVDRLGSMTVRIKNSL